MVDAMTTTNRLTREAGGVVGMGGISGPPLSARAAGESTTQSSSAAISLFTGLPPFLKLIEPNSIPFNPSDLTSLFAHFWSLRCNGEFASALQFCDLILEVLPTDDAGAHLRQKNARAMALRDLRDFRSAYRVHMDARFLLAYAPETLVGDHYHGLGATLTELGEHVRAYKCLEGARHFHQGEPTKLAHTEISTARLLARMGKSGEALEVLDRVSTSTLAADAQIARALAYEAEGNKSEARKAIATALYLLSDSENRATRTEALCVMGRIEGAAAYGELVGEERG